MYNINLIPVELTTSPLALQSAAGHETRPADCSLPVLRVKHTDGRTTWIRESLSILEYFEDLFPSSQGFQDLRGQTLEQKAHTRDILSLLNDAIHWSLIVLVHSHPVSTSWSGISANEMSFTTAKHAERKLHFYLTRLEQWLEEDGEKAMMDSTLASLVIVAQVEYHQMMYEADWVNGHAVLRRWVEGMKEQKWFVESDELKDAERNGRWESLLGK